MTKALESPKNVVRTSLPCLHCGLPTFSHQDESRVFCCNGCMGAYSLIHELGLEDFYSLRSARLPNGFEAGAIDGSRSAILEDMNAAGVEVHSSTDGLCSVRLAVDGLHCAACSWLIERMQPTIPGLQSAQVRMSDQTIELIYDPKRTQPVNVAKKFAKHTSLCRGSTTTCPGTTTQPGWGCSVCRNSELPRNWLAGWVFHSGGWPG